MARLFPRGSIFGLDIKEKCRSFEEDRLRIFVGDQKNIAVLDDIVDVSGPLDVVFDDGSHQAEDQQATIRHLWPRLKHGGLYVIEDIHTSYKSSGRFAMGWRVAGTVEFLKDVIDDIHSGSHGHPQILE